MGGNRDKLTLQAIKLLEVLIGLIKTLIEMSIMQCRAGMMSQEQYTFLDTRP